MTLGFSFIGIDPNTGGNGSPTVWVDHETSDLVIQGWKADERTEAECAAFEVPGHAVGIPDHETVVRVPARMVPILREACDVATLRLPGNDLWVFDSHLVQFNMFDGLGHWTHTDFTEEPDVVEFCTASFEAVWKLATPHAEFTI